MPSLTVRLLAYVLGGLLLLTSPCPAHAEDQRGFLTLTVNADRRGEVPALFRDEAIYLRVQDLEEAHLRVPLGERLDLDTESYVGLDSLSPEITYDYSEELLRVRVIAPAALFQGSTVDLAERKPAYFKVSSDTSAYLNYGISTSNFSMPTFALETGVSVGGTYLFEASASEGPTVGFLRGLTALSYENHEAMSRLIVGDAVLTTDALGGGGTFGGITYRREFMQDPYFIYRPDQVLTGLANTPSMAKIYINGLLVRQQAVPTGPYELHNLAIPSGNRTVTVVLQDAFGRTTEFSTASYLASTILRPGIHDYLFSLGIPRLGTNALYPLGEYGHPALVAADRYGWSDTLTIGGRLEASDQMGSAGGSVSWAQPWGQVDAAAGLSAGSRFASALTGAYTYSNNKYSFGVVGRYVGRNFVNANLPIERDRQVLLAQIFGTYQITGNWGINLSLSQERHRDSGGSASASFSTGLSLGLNISALAFTSYTAMSTGKTDYTVGLSLLYSFGGGDSARVNLQQRKDGKGVGVEVAHPLPYGEGFGYRVAGQYLGPPPAQGTSGAGSSSMGGEGNLQYQGKYGRFEADVTGDTQGGVHHQFSYAGGMAMINGHFMAGRPFEQSFGLVQVDDIPDVKVLVGNTLLGETDRNGRILVPNLIPYYGNKVDVVTEDIPVERNIEVSTRLAIPPLHGGTLVEFRVPKISAIIGNIRPDIKDLRDEFGPGGLLLEGQTEELVIGTHGEFYIENLEPGDHKGRAEFPNLACEVTFRVPASDIAIVNLGDVTCVPK